MKQQKMNSVMFVAALCAISGVFARVPMQQNVRLYNQGRLAGRADAVLGDARLSAQQKEKMLSAIFVDYEKLNMTDATDAQQIKAHLSLAKEQVRSVEGYTAPTAIMREVSGEEMPVDEEVASPVGGDDELASHMQEPEGAAEQEVLLGDMAIEAVAAFGMAVIAQAAKYSNRLQCIGVPTVSHHRELTLRLFLDAAANEEGMRAQVLVAKRVMDALEKEQAIAGGGLSKFIGSFKAHLEKKYGTATEGIEGEIAFKIFQNLAYNDEGGPSIAEAVGVFIKAYNTYVEERFRLSAEELSMPIGQWGQTILGQDKNLSGRLKLLLVSFSMEEVKHDLKREPLMKKLNGAIAEQVQKGTELLAKEGIVLEAAEAKVPTIVAVKCAEVVKRKIDEGGGALAPEMQQTVEAYFGVADQISYLSNDCDMVAREMADMEAIVRLRNEIANLPESDQQLIKQSSAIEKAALDEIVPDMSHQVRSASEGYASRAASATVLGREMEEKMRPRSGMSRRATILIAIGVLVAGALLLHKFKPEAFAWFGGRSDEKSTSSAASSARK